MQFLHVLEDSFSHHEVWPQSYNHLHVSLGSGRSVGKDPDVDIDAELALQFDKEPGVEREELQPLPTDEAPAAESHEPAARLDDVGNEITDKSTDPDDLPEVDIDRPLQVTFTKALGYAPTRTELIRCRCHRDGTLQPISFPKVGVIG